MNPLLLRGSSPRTRRAIRIVAVYVTLSGNTDVTVSNTIAGPRVDNAATPASSVSITSLTLESKVTLNDAVYTSGVFNIRAKGGLTLQNADIKAGSFGLGGPQYQHVPSGAYRR